MSEPNYYNKNGLSPIRAFEEGLISKEEYVGFCKGNVIKYTVRAGEKTDDPLMDIIKAMDYLHYLHKALKSEPVKKEDDDEYTVRLEDKLNEVKENITDFKKEYGLEEVKVEPTEIVAPEPDVNLRHVEPIVSCSSPFGAVKNWVSKEIREYYKK